MTIRTLAILSLNLTLTLHLTVVATFARPSGEKGFVREVQANQVSDSVFHPRGDRNGTGYLIWTKPFLYGIVVKKGIYGCAVFMLYWDVWEYLQNIRRPKSPKGQTLQTLNATIFVAYFHTRHNRTIAIDSSHWI